MFFELLYKKIKYIEQGNKKWRVTTEYYKGTNKRSILMEVYNDKKQEYELLYSHYYTKYGMIYEEKGKNSEILLEG